MDNIKYKDVKITILKKIKVEDIHRQYALDELPVVCAKGVEGQEFISVNCSRPENFCKGAWEGIKNNVELLAGGKNSPYTKEAGVAIRSCNDGLHPVIFKLQRI